MIMLVLAIAAYVFAGCIVLAFMYGWAVQTDSRDHAGHLAELVLKHNANTKVKTEQLNQNRKELTKEIRLIMVDYYNRGDFQRWRYRTFGESKQMRQRIARVKDLQGKIKSAEAEINRYHVLVRGELHRHEGQLPELVEHLRKMLA